MFDKIKGLMDMQKKMQEVKRQLDETTFTLQSGDGSVIISMNGSQEVKEVKIKEGLLDSVSLPAVIKDTFNRAIKRSHEIAAVKMKEASGLNIPGF